MNGADRRRISEGAETLIESMPIEPVDEPTAARMATLFKAMGDPTRIRIVSALSLGERCVRDIASSVGLSQSAVSHQLRMLRDLHLVRTRKEGRKVYYALDDDHVHSLFHQGLDHVQHRDPPNRG
jgi:ArsR family transcriptional regulator